MTTTTRYIVRAFDPAQPKALPLCAQPGPDGGWHEQAIGVTAAERDAAVAEAAAAGWTTKVDEVISRSGR